MEYPQYRKYKNGKSWFCIYSPELLEEIQLLGSRSLIHRLEARIHPDRVYIHDLTFSYEAFAEAVTEEEYRKVHTAASI